jgi:glycine cleavage system H protein
MNIPDHLRYTPHHLWVQAQADGTLLAGITDHAQETLGDIVFVEAPAVGTAIHDGQPCGIVESVKTASDLHAPVSGTVVETNPELQDTPEKINEAPYSAWIFRIRPDMPDSAVSLLDAAAYRSQLD